MADSSEPAFLFLYRKGAVAPVDYLSTFATAPASNKKPAGMASVQTIPAGFDAFYLKRFAGNDAPAFMTLNIKTAAVPAYTAP